MTYVQTTCKFLPILLVVVMNGLPPWVSGVMVTCGAGVGVYTMPMSRTGPCASRVCTKIRGEGGRRAPSIVGLPAGATRI